MRAPFSPLSRPAPPISTPPLASARKSTGLSVGFKSPNFKRASAALGSAEVAAFKEEIGVERTDRSRRALPSCCDQSSDACRSPARKYSTQVSRKNNPNYNVDWGLHSEVQVGKQVKYTQAQYTNRHQHAHIALHTDPKVQLVCDSDNQRIKYSLVLCIRVCTCVRAFMHVCVVWLYEYPKGA